MRHTKLLQFFVAFLGLLLASNLFSQTVLEGYAYEEGNRGYLNQVKVTVFQMPDNIVRAELVTDMDGHFMTKLAPGEYRIVGKKDVFIIKEMSATVGAEKVFLKMEMKRKPGYLFDATIAESRVSDDVVVDALHGITIEIYNRTQKKPELVLKQHPNAFFQHNFEQGNHYTLMLRKPGYLTKRIEAYVNIKGCIICVDGVSNLRPGITDNLTEGNTMGTLLCNIEMDKVSLDKRIELRNIYYDYDKSDIRPDAAIELDKAISLLTDNPTITFELGSHTDSRGSDAYNLSLSQKRAEAAVAYFVGKGIPKGRITAQGYGETQLANRCKNGVNCSDEEHQKNRRTELKIIGISKDSLEYLSWRSLEEMVREEEFNQAMKELENQQEYKVEAVPEKTKTEPVKQKMEDAPKSAQTKTEQKTVEVDAKEMAVVGTVSEQTRTFPKGFNGFSVEIARTDIELGPDHAIFKQNNEVFVNRDIDDMFCYFTGNFSSVSAARTFYQTRIISNYPSARLCRFINGVKSYVN